MRWVAGSGRGDHKQISALDMGGHAAEVIERARSQQTFRLTAQKPKNDREGNNTTYSSRFCYPRHDKRRQLVC